ncbi:MAG: BatD family protein [Gammaproteobacteria bacterium]|nr:BatD family protein [Gammaproteobacteria bacterium]
MVSRYFLIVFVFFCFTPQSLFAAANARVDRSTVTEGESFQLIITGDNGEPNVQNLSRSFQVLNSSQSRQMSFVNGSMNSNTTWTYTLMPKAKGKFRIPAIQVGKDLTTPIDILVSNAQNNSSSGGANDLILEIDVDSKSVFVQQQIILTVRLYNAIEIQSGSLSQPELSNAAVERLGDDVGFRSSRAGRNFHVTERKYAIFPQKSGELEIPPIVFSGNVVRNTSRRSNDPFASFFQQQQLVPRRVQSSSIKLKIKPIPKEFNGGHWLPAKALSLKQTISPQVSNYTAGEPITRSIRIEALGLMGSQLPEIIMSNTPGFKIYRDQAKSENFPEDNGIASYRVENIAIVATQAGNFSLPEIRLPWWNTDKNQLEYAVLPAIAIQVVADALKKQMTQDKLDPQSSEAAPSASTPTTALVSNRNNPFWIFSTGIFALAWLITIGLWRRATVQQTTPSQIATENPKKQLGMARQALKHACLSNNAIEARQQLQLWLKFRYPDQHVNLSHLSQLLGNRHLSSALAELDRHLYSQEQQQWDGQSFWDLFDASINANATSQSATVSLPALFSN